MADVYMIDVGEWTGNTVSTYRDDGTKIPLVGMSVYSRVQITAATGVNDPWICDGFLQKIGAGNGTWTLKPSSKELFLWGRNLEFQAKFKYGHWPLQMNATGDIELRNGIYFKKNLQYWVTMVRLGR